MPRVLRITDWGKHFECSQSRNLVKMAWVPVRVNLAGDGYTELLNHSNGAAHFGGWIGLVEVGALCEPRGTLIRSNGKPHDAESLSRITRVPVEIMAEAIPRLLSIGWLEHETAVTQQDDEAILQDTVACQRKFVATDSTDSTDITVQDRTKTPCSSADEREAGPSLKLAPPKPTNTDDFKVWFDSEFWPLYPRRVGKPQAFKTARRYAKTVTDRMAIMDCLTRRLPALREQFRADGDFRPYPSTWLGQEPWNDPEDVSRPTVKRTGVDTALDKVYAELQHEQDKGDAR